MLPNVKGFTANTGRRTSKRKKRVIVRFFTYTPTLTLSVNRTREREQQQEHNVKHEHKIGSEISL